MKRGFGFRAWLDARKRLLRSDADARARIRAVADERRVRAALDPSTGNVAPSPIHPPRRGTDDDN